MTTQKRNANGTFGKGHSYATGRPTGSANKLTIEMLKIAQTWSEEEDFTPIHGLRMIAENPEASLDLKVKCYSKLADIFYIKHQAVAQEAEKLSSAEIDIKLKETLARFNATNAGSKNND